MIERLIDSVGLEPSKVATNHSQTKPIEPIKELQKEATELSKDELKLTMDIIKVLNELPGNKLEFGFNEEARMATISVFERDNHKLIREFPSREFFNRLAYFRDNILPGLIMDEKV